LQHFLLVWLVSQIKIVASVTVYSNFHQLDTEVTRLSKYDFCDTIFNMSHMFHLSHTTKCDICHKIPHFVTLFHFILARLDWLAVILGVTYWCHTLCPSFIGLFLSRPEVSNVSNFVHIINTWTIFCTSHRCTWTCGWTTRNFDAFVNGKWNWSNSNYDHGIEPHDREIHYSPPSNHFHGL